MIAVDITRLIGEAMKAHDQVRLSTLRMLSSALNYEKIAKQHELSSEEEVGVVRKEAKKRKDAIEAYTKANAPERAAKEEAELAILREFLPEEMSEADLAELVNEAIDETGATQISEMGKVIGLVMGKAKGRVEGSRVSQLVKARLTS